MRALSARMELLLRPYDNGPLSHGGHFVLRELLFMSRLK